jgi:hypothetical protein
MDVDNLRACYDSLEAGKATGVDGVTRQQYGKDLWFRHRVKPIIFVLPMIFWPVLKARRMHGNSASDWKTGWKALVCRQPDDE